MKPISRKLPSHPSSARAETKRSKVLVENMTPSEQAALEPVLRPHQSSQTGFLAPGESLGASAAAKAKVLRDNNVSFDALADRIDELESERSSHPGLKVHVNRYRGVQWCPFPECKAGSNADIVIKQISTGREITIPGLMSDLVRNHHFLEGNVPYGLDPQDAVDILGLGNSAEPQATAQAPEASNAAPALPGQDYLSTNHAELIAKIKDRLGSVITRQPSFDVATATVVLGVQIAGRAFGLSYPSDAIRSLEDFKNNFNADTAFLHLHVSHPQFRLESVNGTDNVATGAERSVQINGVGFQGQGFDEVFDRSTGTINLAALRQKIEAAGGTVPTLRSASRSAFFGDQSPDKLEHPFFFPG